MLWQQVQQLFAEALHHSSSQPFFIKFRSLFQESVDAICEQKRKVWIPPICLPSPTLCHIFPYCCALEVTTCGMLQVKQAAAEKTALLKAGIAKKTEDSTYSLASSQVHMVEVMKTMRRMCMGQFRPLQDILRSQRLNHTSFDFFNEAVQYIKNLEPELKDCIHDGDFEVVDGAIRGFLMLADSMRGPNLDNQKAISETVASCNTHACGSCLLSHAASAMCAYVPVLTLQQELAFPARKVSSCCNVSFTPSLKWYDCGRASKVLESIAENSFSNLRCSKSSPFEHLLQRRLYILL